MIFLNLTFTANLKELEIIKTCYTNTFQKVPHIDVSQLKITQLSDPTRRNRKQYFCIYCKRCFVNLPRHLKNMHRDVDIIKKLINLPGMQSLILIINCVPTYYIRCRLKKQSIAYIVI